MTALRAAAFFVGLVLSGVPSAWAINKCTGPDGKVVFQDAACSGAGEKLEVRPASGNAPPASSGDASVPDWKRDAAGVDKRLAILAAIQRGEAVVGMTGEQLQQAMGLPNRINTGEYQSGSRQQRIYERRGTTWYVYTDEKFVTAVQSSIGPGASVPKGPCPTSLEIRNAETSASSAVLTEPQRLEMLKQIRDMRNCGR